jgi:hypothetical protein
MIIKRLQILINHAEVNFAVILSFFFSFIPHAILRDALTLYEVRSTKYILCTYICTYTYPAWILGRDFGY